MTRRDGCRICAAPMDDVLDMGQQRIQGAFPAFGEPDPPAFPLVLARCQTCGLVQLRHTVPPDVLYGHGYFYRSGVSQTMRKHLWGIAEETRTMLGDPAAASVLDVGCNDGSLLSYLPTTWDRTGIDPSGVPLTRAADGIARIRGLFPRDMMLTQKYDAVFSIACFYDVDDPLEFARAVKKILAPHGLWCLEVAYLHDIVQRLAYDGVCHEHLLYLDIGDIQRIAAESGLRLVKVTGNQCNGGSIRVYLTHYQNDRYGSWTVDGPTLSLDGFADRVKQHKRDLAKTVGDLYHDGQCMHLLGASTKLNTLLQWCGLDSTIIDVASDRDTLKHGRRTPGTNIPIVSEEESRGMDPGVYVVGPYHFRDELVEREKAFLDGGGKLLFPLPKIELKAA